MLNDVPFISFRISIHPSKDVFVLPDKVLHFSPLFSWSILSNLNKLRTFYPSIVYLNTTFWLPYFLFLFIHIMHVKDFLKKDNTLEKLYLSIPQVLPLLHSLPIYLILWKPLQIVSNVPTLGHHYIAEVYDDQSSQMDVIASTGIIERHFGV